VGGHGILYPHPWASEGGQGALPPQDIENFSKKGCFLNFDWKKQISPLLAPPRKILKKSPSAPPGKNLSDAHVPTV